jgi:glutaconate CoA-transferase subunit A
VRSILGSDILKSNPQLKVVQNPLESEPDPVVLVPPLVPDAAILPVPRADSYGNCHYWGNSGVLQEAGLAARKVILLAEELVETSVITSDPSRVPFPGFKVTAVVHERAGQHPSPMTGHWKRDNAFFNDYHAQSRDVAGFRAWLDAWVFSCPDHASYLRKLGPRLEGLRIQGKALAAPANYAGV